VVLVLFCVAVATAALGSGRVQAWAMVAAALIAAFVITGLRMSARPAPQVLDEAPPDPQAWQRERDQWDRAQAERGGSASEPKDAFGKRRS
jgi:hypothetical protein